ncbi:MAG: hypothetical protein V9H26_01420 [Verrucomicrobiota bacterium]
MFYEKIAFPLAQAFARLPQLPFGRDIQTKDVLKWRCDYVWNTNIMVGVSLYFTNRMLIDLSVKGTNCAVLFFGDGRVNPHAIAGHESPTKANAFSRMTNSFDDHSVLEFATAFFKAARHQPKNFHPPKVWHMGWGDPADKRNYIPLPFYEFEWLRKDVGLVQPGEVHHPRVIVVVSGISGQVLSYQRLFLPITGDFEPSLPGGQPPLNEKTVNSITNSP